jgi:hypothetical protein
LHIEIQARAIGVSRREPPREFLKRALKLRRLFQIPVCSTTATLLAALSFFSARFNDYSSNSAVCKEKIFRLLKPGTTGGKEQL